jgi:multisubunit Na+/H+ antiporter MnhC subunit
VKVWVETIGILFGVLLIVAGAILALVTGLDLLYSGAALLLIGVGAVLVWRIRVASPYKSEKTLTTGRSVQRPLSDDEQKKGEFKGRM